MGLVGQVGLVGREHRRASAADAAVGPRAEHGSWRLLLASSMIAVWVVSPAAQSKAKPRLFPPTDLGLIQPPDRDQWQRPDQIMDALGIADGSVVAELGAGGGWFTLRLARRVGPNGRVYAEDIQRQMLEAIERRVQRENLPNVVPVLGTATDPRLPPGLDAALIVNAFHEMDDPVTLFRNVGRSLKPHGRLGVVDFNGGGGGPGPPADQRVDPQAVIEAAEAAGFQLTTREAVGPFQFLLVFGRAPDPRGRS